MADTDKRGWIPNPDGKGLPHPKKWKGKSTAIRIPVEQKDLLLNLARAIDTGEIPPSSVQALINGETPAPRRGENPPAEKRYLTQDEYNLIERWVPHVEREKVESAGFAWLYDAPGTALGSKYFCIKNLGELLDWIHTPEGAAAWAAASKSPTTSPATEGTGDDRLIIAHRIAGYTRPKIGDILPDAQMLVDRVAAGQDGATEEQIALANELDNAINGLPGKGQVNTIKRLAKELAIAVLGWEGDNA